MTQDEIQAVALKPCPFCGGELLVTYRPANGAQPHMGCKRCNAIGPYTAGMTEAQWRAAWNTRADAAPTPKADEVEAVGFAMWKAEADRAAPNVGKNRTIENYRYDLDPIGRAKWDQIAQAAIAALDAARGDPVARVVEWLRSDKAFCLTNLEIADAIERGEPFNG